MIKEAIIKIVNKEDLTYDEAYDVMNEIMSGETTSTQNAAFLASLSTKSVRAETLGQGGTMPTASIFPLPRHWWRRQAGSRWRNMATALPLPSAAQRIVWRLLA